ncbi:hypothetical protein HUX88_24825 [Duganella sp. BJB1802]|uniref:hypothetical protein n=1 Tax=Duganella sp. BJB1802 TaxID=2744575 RepID=UPI001593040C|nr:hypothetical protein [Duganella sp. BJB1802]NVD73735.1 hypothetical protein [Duganella sp. BJB1802]
MTNYRIGITRRKFICGMAASAIPFGHVFGTQITALQMQREREAALKNSGVSLLQVPPVPKFLEDNPILIANQADVLLRQLQKGLGYYGQPRNWVPLNTYTPGALDTYFNSAEQLMLDFAQLNSIGVSNAAVKLTKQKATESVNARRQRMLADIAKAQLNVRDMQDFIKQLKNEIDAQKIIVDECQKQFKAAVLRTATGGDGCSVSEVIGIVVAVVAVAAAIYTAGTSLEALYADGAAVVGAAGAVGTAIDVTNMIQSLEALYASCQTFVKQVQVVEADFKKIQQAFDGLDKTLAESDRVKVMVDPSYYDDQTIDRLNSFDSTVMHAGISPDIEQKFIDAMHQLVNLIQTKNKKLIEHDSIILQIQAAAQVCIMLTLEANQLDTDLAKFIDNNNLPDQETYLKHLQIAQEWQLDTLRELVWYATRAVALRELNPSFIHSSAAQLMSVDNRYDTSSLDDLKAMYTNIGLASEINDFRTNPLHQALGPYVIEYTLSDADRNQLVKSGILTLRVPINQFDEGKTELRMTHYSFDTEPTFIGLHGILYHLGEQRFIKSTDGSVIEFSSLPVGLSIDDNTKSPNNLTEISAGDAYFGISPLSSWKVQFLIGDNKKLANVKKFRLGLSILITPAQPGALKVSQDRNRRISNKTRFKTLTL